MKFHFQHNDFVPIVRLCVVVVGIKHGHALSVVIIWCSYLVDLHDNTYLVHLHDNAYLVHLHGSTYLVIITWCSYLVDLHDNTYLVHLHGHVWELP